MSSYISQAVNSLRQEPLISTIAVIGTALAIFLIMVVVMTEQLPYTDIAPELNKDRWLTHSNASIKSEGGTSNGAMSYPLVKTTFYKMTTPEEVTAFCNTPSKVSLSLPSGSAISGQLRDVDDRFFKVFTFRFIDGEPFSREQFEAGVPVAVISRSIARKLFGSTEVAGKEILIDHTIYRISGVVDDVPGTSLLAYADVWVPFTATIAADLTWNNYMGVLSVLILAKSHDDFPAIRREYEQIFNDFNRSIADEGWEMVSLDRPYDIEQHLSAPYANIGPQVEQERRRRYITFAILLLVPAVNLSTMTHSHLSRRVREIGVRRAFGATRFEILRDLFMENFVITLLAGIIGLVLSVVFAYLFIDAIMTPTAGAQSFTGLSILDLLRWSTFGWALLFCFVLNLLSAGVPAWRASRTNIVTALNRK